MTNQLNAGTVVAVQVGTRMRRGIVRGTEAGCLLVELERMTLLVAAGCVVLCAEAL